MDPADTYTDELSGIRFSPLIMDTYYSDNNGIYTLKELSSDDEVRILTRVTADEQAS